MKINALQTCCWKKKKNFSSARFLFGIACIRDDAWLNSVKPGTKRTLIEIIHCIYICGVQGRVIGKVNARSAAEFKINVTYTCLLIRLRAKLIARTIEARWNTNAFDFPSTEIRHLRPIVPSLVFRSSYNAIDHEYFTAFVNANWT